MNKSELKVRLKSIRAIRAIAYPFMKAKEAVDRHFYKKSASYQFFKSCKDTCAGKRCFIIGNGPSLTPEDLDKIKDEVTFATNRIYYMFDQTEWRPSYYMCIDMSLLDSQHDMIEKLSLPHVLININAKKMIKSKNENIKYMMINRTYIPDVEHFKQQKISTDVSYGFSTTATVTCSAIEMAIYMGFKDIYLIGMDHSYNIQSGGNGINTANADSYFKGMKAENITIPKNRKETTEASYMVYKKYADENGVNIVNVTRGGKLEIFKRADFDDVISM